MTANVNVVLVAIARAYAVEILARHVGPGLALPAAFAAGFEIGAGLALVAPDMARSMVDSNADPESLRGISDAVDALLKAGA